MPISHKYKLIFIHIPKCAGISVWNSLDLSVSADNLISITKPALQHLHPKELIGKYIDKKTWDSYKKFTIVRNPYDRVISDYFWLKMNSDSASIVNGDFDDFLSLREDVVKNNKFDQNLYYDHFYSMSSYFEEIQYDYVIRFENIEEEFEELRKNCNLPNKLPKYNESVKTELVLTENQKNRIYNLYKEDFDNFGYGKYFKKVNLGIKTEKEKRTLQIKNTKVQVFFAKDDLIFSEERSFQQNVSLNETLNVVYEFGAEQGKFKYLRFDICDSLGFLSINNLEIKNSLEEVIWRLDIGDVIKKQDLLFIKDVVRFPEKLIHLSVGEDPFFVLEIPDKVGMQISDKVVLHINISPLSHEEIVYFVNGKNEVLSSNTNDSLELSESIVKPYIHRNELLEKTLENNRVLLDNLKDSLADLIDKINIKEKVIVDLDLKYELLSHDLIERNVTIGDLNKIISDNTKEKDELSIEIYNYTYKIGLLESELSKIKIELEILKNYKVQNEFAVEGLKKIISQLEDSYEKKNLMQIAYNRLFRKKSKYN